MINVRLNEVIMIKMFLFSYILIKICQPINNLKTKIFENCMIKNKLNYRFYIKILNRFYNKQ